MKDRKEIYKIEEGIAARMALRQSSCSSDGYIAELAFSRVIEGDYRGARQMTRLLDLRNPARDFVNAMIYSRQGDFFLADLSYRQTIFSSPDFASEIENLRQLADEIEFSRENLETITTDKPRALPEQATLQLEPVEVAAA